MVSDCAAGNLFTVKPRRAQSDFKKILFLVVVIRYLFLFIGSQKVEPFLTFSSSSFFFFLVRSQFSEQNDSYLDSSSRRTEFVRQALRLSPICLRHAIGNSICFVIFSAGYFNCNVFSLAPGCGANNTFSVIVLFSVAARKFLKIILIISIAILSGKLLNFVVRTSEHLFTIFRRTPGRAIFTRLFWFAMRK